MLNETISNVFFDPENLQTHGISLKIAISGYFPCVQKFDYENVHVSDDMCIFILNGKWTLLLYPYSEDNILA